MWLSSLCRASKVGAVGCGTTRSGLATRDRASPSWLKEFTWNSERLGTRNGSDPFRTAKGVMFWASLSSALTTYDSMHTGRLTTRVDLVRSQLECISSDSVHCILVFFLDDGSLNRLIQTMIDPF